jgi:ABC-type oligopeptide transport system ATPase subunit
LLGSNGSGKSTTLLTIATVYRPTSGDIYVFGHSVAREGDAVRRYVGIAFQEPKAMRVDSPTSCSSGTPESSATPPRRPKRWSKRLWSAWACGSTGGSSSTS